MRTILIVAGHVGSGQTTVLVNLASGLAPKGYQVLIGDRGNQPKFNHWLRLDGKPDRDSDANWARDVWQVIFNAPGWVSIS
jgi:Mrp family chromosome partitioning ATPase